MAKAKVIAGPEPLPTVGDVVQYFWPPIMLGGKSSDEPAKAKVTFVYDGFDGRLVDIEAQDGNAMVTIKSVPWRDDGAGNTWSWPDAPAAK